jgi:hypothetical protein
MKIVREPQMPFHSDHSTYAEDTQKSSSGCRIAAAGWKVVGYPTAQDALIPAKGASDRKLGIDHGKRVYYGFMAQSLTIPTSCVAVIRGTDGILEWIMDAEFVPIPHPRPWIDC